MRFADHVAVIAGAGSGIGKAIAMGLAPLGSSLYLIGRNKEKLDEVSHGAKGAPRVVACAADLARDDDIRRVCDDVYNEFGKVDILVHSLGVFASGAVDIASLDDFDMQFRTNLRAPYALTKTLLPMITPMKGQVVFINSSAGYHSGRAGLSQYAATKHGLRAFADSLREEINPNGMRVLSVYPGRTATPMQEAVHGIEGKPYNPSLLLQPEDVASVVIHALGLPGTAEVTDICIRPMVKQ